jgi:hypothetical protein
METKPETEEECVPSHNMEGKYAILAETNNQYKESWYYLIRYDTNVTALEYLYKQLDSIEWIYLESYSSFTMDLENLISPTTAKELTKICVNDGSSHRKFDGTLEFINFEFRKKDCNITRLIKVCDTIGNGEIEKYIDQEDFDPEDYENEEGEDEEEDEEEEEDDVEKKESPSSSSSSEEDTRTNNKSSRKN